MNSVDWKQLLGQFTHFITKELEITRADAHLASREALSLRRRRLCIEDSTASYAVSGEGAAARRLCRAVF